MRTRADKFTRIVPDSGKIYDITHADTLEHTVSLPSGYPENTRAIIISPLRVSGTGTFLISSVSGGQVTEATSYRQMTWIRASDGLFYYKLLTSGDDWDIHSAGYMTGEP